MLDESQFKSVLGVASEPVRQLGGYELDLIKLGYYSWINGISLGMSFWRSQFEGPKVDQ